MAIQEPQQSRARAQLLSAIKNQHGGAHSMWYYIYIYIGVLWRCSPQHRSRQPALKRSRAPAYICSVEPHLLYAVYAQTIFRYIRVFGVVHKSKALVCKKYMCEKKRITYIHASIYNIEMKAAMRHHLPTARRGRALIHNYVVGIVVWPDARPTYEWNAIPHNGTQRSFAAIGTSQLRTAQSQSYICYISLCVTVIWCVLNNQSQHAKQCFRTLRKQWSAANIYRKKCHLLSAHFIHKTRYYLMSSTVLYYSTDNLKTR